MIFLLIYPPLFFGAVEPSALQVILPLPYILGLILLLQRTVWPGQYKREALKHSHRARFSTPLMVAALMILLYGILMTVPVPSGLHKLLSPRSYSLYAGVGQVLAEGGKISSYPLSLDVFSSIGALLSLMSYFIFFIVCLEGFPSWKLSRAAASIFIFLVFFVSVLGIIQYTTWGGRILWAGLITGEAKPFGPFVNRNHFAAWAGMGAMLGIGYFFSMKHRHQNGEERHKAEKPDRNLLPKRILVGFMTIIIIAAVFLSQSRGGIVSLIAGMTFFSFMLSLRKRMGRAWKVSLIFLFAILVVVWIGAEPVVQRLGSIFDISVLTRPRADLNRDLLHMVGEFPLTGTGPGSFRSVYPIFQTPNQAYTFTYGHNDYLQLMVEWGALGSAIFAAGAAFFWWMFLGMWRRRRNLEVLFLSAGAAGGLVMIMAHSVVDFNMHIPSNALAFMFLASFALKTIRARSTIGNDADKDVH